MAWPDALRQRCKAWIRQCDLNEHLPGTDLAGALRTATSDDRRGGAE